MPSRAHSGKEGFKLWVLGKEAAFLMLSFFLPSVPFLKCIFSLFLKWKLHRDLHDLGDPDLGDSVEAGKVIGRGGETVREIMQRTGAEIQVPIDVVMKSVKTNQEVTNHI